MILVTPVILFEKI